MLYFSLYGNKYIVILENLYLGLEYGLCARDLRQHSYCLMNRNIQDVVIVGGRTAEFGLNSDKFLYQKESY
jgi:hypothetical protein